jgi:RHS repeat-associated protein
LLGALIALAAVAPTEAWAVCGTFSICIPGDNGDRFFAQCSCASGSPPTECGSGSTDLINPRTFGGAGCCMSGNPNSCTDATPLTGFACGPVDEVCNGLDDDCDGQVDEGTITCGTGECTRTVPACVNGQPNVCTPGPAKAEVCDAKDNNCDGETDNTCKPLDCQEQRDAPVQLASGNMLYGPVVLARIPMPVGPPLLFEATYNSRNPRAGALGNGWTLNTEQALVPRYGGLVHEGPTGGSTQYDLPAPSSFEADTARFVTQPAPNLTRARDGSPFSLFTVDNTDFPCAPTQPCFGLFGRLLDADGAARRFHISGSAFFPNNAFMGWSDRFGNAVHLNRSPAPSGGDRTELISGPQRLQLDTRTDAAGVRVGTVALVQGAQSTPLVELRFSAQQQLAEVCDLTSLPANNCSNSQCGNKRSLWRFEYSAVSGAPASQPQAMTGTHDETCELVESHDYFPFHPQTGVQARTSVSPANSLEFAYLADASGIRPSSVSVLAQLKASTGQTSSVNSQTRFAPGVLRVNEVDATCGCGPATTREWGRLADGTPVIDAENIGKRRVVHMRRPGLQDDPFGFGLPTLAVHHDLAPEWASPSQTFLYRYLHPWVRRATSTDAPGPSGTRHQLVDDYDDDDASFACIDGYAPDAATSVAIANEKPTRFLCRRVEVAEGPGGGVRVTRFRWDTRGRLLLRVEPGGNSSSFTYHPDDDGDASRAGRLASATHAGPGVLPLTTLYSDYHFTGQAQRVEAPNGEVTLLGFDGLGRQTHLQAPDGMTTDTEWAATGKPGVVVQSPRDRTLTYHYGPNNMGRLTRLEWRGAQTGPVLFARTWQHDFGGNVIVETDEDMRGATTVTRRRARDFDESHRVTKEFNAQGGFKSFSYKDALLWQVTDEKGFVTEHRNDGFGRLRELSAAPYGTLSGYLYDEANNLTSVIDANGNATDYNFDGFGNLRSVLSKDTGLTEYGYTADGLLSRKQDAPARARSELLETSFDGLRRPVLQRLVKYEEQQVCLPPPIGCQVIRPEVSSQVLTRNTWDDVSRRARGRLSRVEDYFSPSAAPLVTDYFYDSEGRVEEERATRPGVAVPLSLQYRYFEGGRLRQLVYPPQTPGSGALPTGLLAELGEDDEVSRLSFGGADFATSVQHQPFGGGLKAFTRGNSLSTTFTHNLDGQRTRVTAGSRGPVSLEYTLEARGLVEALSETGDVPRSRKYGHDALLRLESAEHREAASGPVVFSEAFTYDKAGNRLLKVRDDGKTFRSVFDWKAGTTDVPANNLLREVIDPQAAGECETPGNRPAPGGGAGKPLCPGQRGVDNQRLAQVEAAWKALLNDARETLKDLPALSEAQVRGRAVALVEGLRAMLTKYKLSASTLQLLLLEAESPQGSFSELLNEFLARRAAGTAVGAADIDLLQRMLVLAESVQVRRAVVTDPTWVYTHDAAGNVVQVTLHLEPPATGRVVLVETSHCSRYDALGRLVKVEWVTRRGAQVLNPVPPCDEAARLTTMAEYRYNAQNLRVYSRVLGIETHFLFSPEGQLLAEADNAGALQRQYIYLEGEPLAQVVLQEGSSNRPLPFTFGCSASGEQGGGRLWALAALVLLMTASRRGSRAQRRGAAVVALLAVASCRLEDTAKRIAPKKTPASPGRPSNRAALVPTASLNGADPVYFFHNDRLGTPIRLSDEAGETVWRAEYRPFGDLESLEVDPDRDGIPVENNLRLPGQYDEALASVLLFQQGPYYNWNRWYDPGNGRFWQHVPDPSSARSLIEREESYAYGRNSPLQYIDPSGLAPPAIITDVRECVQMGCISTLLCNQCRCSLQACGRGSCKGCPQVASNLLFKLWCSFKCADGKGAAFFETIGGFRFKVCEP